ncbi:hypothetical protein BH18ACT9_BH18ACT9_16320 [soil metagenome]
MTEPSRRRFIGVAGAGAAAAGATVLVPTAAAAAQTRLKANGATEPVVAWVSDTDSDELTLMVGEREVRVRDRDLVNRILNAAGK